jgi:pyruvate,orthophosphate dikinase
MQGEPVGDGSAAEHDAIASLDGSCTLSRARIGGKAWGLNRMRRLGLPVPSAIVVAADAAGGVLTDDMWTRIAGRVGFLEPDRDRRFGSCERPMLVSVRSGAALSMPGMMETVLNVGINDRIERALATTTGDRDHAARVHQRFRVMYSRVALGLANDQVPADPWDQLRCAIVAVLGSWNSARARDYRRHRGLSDDGGTAVTVQAMVFGDLDDRSGTGVVTSRNPMTGERAPWGEWAARRQGVDLVSGHHDPQPLTTLGDVLPGVHGQLLRAAALIEAAAQEVQEIEFTVESGRLWLLQSRASSLAPGARARIAADLASEGLITSEEAQRRTRGSQLADAAVLRPVADGSGRRPLAVGVCACPGVVTGLVVTDPDEACERAQRGEDIILARPATVPGDIHGVIAARAAITEHGGATSHAAVICREIGRPCIVGCGPGSVTSLAGRRITVDAERGHVWPASERDQQPGPTGSRPGGGGRGPRASDELGSAEPAMELFRMIGLKGTVTPAALAVGLDVPPEVVADVTGDLVRRGLCDRARDWLQLSETGKQLLRGLAIEERAVIDQSAMARYYAEFCEYNSQLKRLITAWQLTREDDAAADRPTLRRLSDLHLRIRGLLDELAALAPRLSRYQVRLSRAEQRVSVGDHSYVAAPFIDSYHTIWFELHQDLIWLTGRERTREPA